MESVYTTMESVYNTSPRATTAVSGPQNTLFPSVSVNKW
jgi:hypothetical protein